MIQKFLDYSKNRPKTTTFGPISERSTTMNDAKCSTKVAQKRAAFAFVAIYGTLKADAHFYRYLQCFWKVLTIFAAIYCIFGECYSLFSLFAAFVRSVLHFCPYLRCFWKVMPTSVAIYARSQRDSLAQPSHLKRDDFGGFLFEWKWTSCIKELSNAEQSAAGHRLGAKYLLWKRLEKLEEVKVSQVNLTNDLKCNKSECG